MSVQLRIPSPLETPRISHYYMVSRGLKGALNCGLPIAERREPLKTAEGTFIQSGMGVVIPKERPPKLGNSFYASFEKKKTIWPLLVWQRGGSGVYISLSRTGTKVFFLCINAISYNVCIISISVKCHDLQDWGSNAWAYNFHTHAHTNDGFHWF